MTDGCETKLRKCSYCKAEKHATTQYFHFDKRRNTLHKICSECLNKQRARKKERQQNTLCSETSDEYTSEDNEKQTQCGECKIYKTAVHQYFGYNAKRQGIHRTCRECLHNC